MKIWPFSKGKLSNRYQLQDDPGKELADKDLKAMIVAATRGKVKHVGQMGKENFSAEEQKL